MRFARDAWMRIETIHAVTYFAPESRGMARDAGLKGFWMGYFGFRAAPLGAAPAALVEATFGNFAPAMVARAVPDAWSHAAPSALVDARARAAAVALRQISQPVDAAAPRLVDRLEQCARRGTAAGRPLFAANRAVTTRDDPVEQLWQLCTTIREHRGDGHLAVLTAAGIDGCEAHVMFAAERGTPPELLQESRGWTSEEWAAAAARLADRDLLTRGGAITDEGRASRTRVESATDRLAGQLFEHLDGAERAQLLDDLDAVAVPVVESGTIPFPNPMGLPQLAG